MSRVPAATLCSSCCPAGVVIEIFRSFGFRSFGCEVPLVWEVSIDARALDKCGQATKGVWGMSWHQEAMKGVEVCEKLGGVDKQMMIPRFPN